MVVVPADRESNSEPPIQPSDLGEPHDEHEAADGESAECATDTSNDTLADANLVEEDYGNIADTRSVLTIHVQRRSEVGKVAASAIPDENIPVSPTKSKSGLSVKAPQGKTPSGQPTPIVKKIINSGTFGSGTVKTAPRNSVASSSSMKPATTSAPPLKKSSSTPPAATARPSAARTSVSAAVPSRRASVVPTKPATSAGTKTGALPTASRTAAATVSSVTPRPSVISPTGSTASLKSSTAIHRPRPSVSEPTKRATPTSVKSSSTATAKPPVGATKPSTARSSATTGSATKPSKPSTSVDSIHEVKENGNGDEEGRIKEANEELALKAQAVNDLENQVKQLQASLADAQAEAAAKISLIEELERAKASMAVGYQDQLKTNSKQRDEVTGTAAEQLKAAEEQISTLQSAVQVKEEQILSLTSQKSTLEIGLLEATEKLAAFHRSHETAAREERQTLLKTEVDLKAAASEIDALKLSHTQVNEALKSKTQELEECAAQLKELEARIAEMRTGREEHANKVSELEVEVLELKESQEILEDERDKLQAKAKDLEDHVSTLTTAAQQADADSHAKQAEVEARITELEAQHAGEIQLGTEERARIAAELEALEAQLERARHDLETAKKDADAAAQAQSQKLKEAEDAFALQKSKLEQECRRINAELEGQEAKYNSQLDAVRAEHEVLLQDAFKRAKIEAGEDHALELQQLRESSKATIEQIQAANEANISNLGAEYGAARESEVKELEKQIGTLNLNLRATKDDLSKAKAALEAARLELEALTKQRDDASAADAAAPPVSTEHLEEIARLTNELSRTKDDLNTMTDTLNLTKASLSELSINHEKELEEVAKARAGEVTKIRAAHDAEIATFATQKSELSMRISDLEGEVATVRASIATEHAAPKNNGVTAPHPPDSTGVTKEELQRMHDAHNLKLYDLEAQHEKAMKALREELRVAQQKADELHQEVARKAMEIQYLEQDQEDHQEQIARLKEDFRVATQRPYGEQTPST